MSKEQTKNEKSKSIKKVKKDIKKNTKKITKKVSAEKKQRPASEKLKLINDLAIIAKDLSEDKILFLIQQASVIRHNMRVDEIRKKENDQIKVSHKAIETPSRPPVSIKESSDNSYFVVNINGYGSFFTLEEMRKLVRICHSSGNAIEAGERMYTWLSKDRIDVLNNNKIQGRKDILLAELYELIIKTYTVK